MFPEVQALDVTGPLEVFALANRLSPARAPRYQISVLAAEAGAVSTSSGLSLLAGRGIRQANGPVDTLLVAGGHGTRAAMRDARLVSWIRRTAPRARRVASVCSGAFLLGEAGLLDGRRATTHWAVCEALQRRYPTARVEHDPIFVRDGKISTSAGVTAGMDLALELVVEDGGRDLALASVCTGSSTTRSPRSGPARPQPRRLTSWRGCGRACARGWSATRRRRSGRSA